MGWLNYTPLNSNYLKLLLKIEIYKSKIQMCTPPPAWLHPCLWVSRVMGRGQKKKKKSKSSGRNYVIHFGYYKEHSRVKVTEKYVVHYFPTKLQIPTLTLLGLWGWVVVLESCYIDLLLLLFPTPSASGSLLLQFWGWHSTLDHSRSKLSLHFSACTHSPGITLIWGVRWWL